MTVVIKPGGVVTGQRPEARFVEVALRDLHTSGILWEINRKVLWDLGLSMNVELAPGADGSNSDRYLRLYVVENQPPERIVDASDDGAAFERFQRWLQTRLGRVAP